MRTRGSRAAVVALTAAFLLGDCRKSKNQELRVLAEDSANLTALQTVLPDFTRETGIRVAIDRRTFEDLERTADEVLSRHLPTYDVVLNYNFSLSPYVRNRWTYELHELETLHPDSAGWHDLKVDFFPKPWREVGWYRDPSATPGTEHPVSVPFAINTMLLCANMRLLENQDHRTAFRRAFHRELTIPSSWSEMRDVIQYFGTANGTKGIVLQGGAGGWVYYEWAAVAFGQGGGVFKKTYGWEGDSTTPLLIESDSTINATKWYMALKPYDAGDFFSIGQLEQREIMKRDNVALAIMWSDIAYDLVRDTTTHTRCSPMPGGRAMIGGGAFYVNRSSRQPGAAARFILWVLDRQRQRQLLRLGYASPRLSAYEGDSTDHFARALFDSFRNGVYMNEAGPDATLVAETLTKYLQMMWRGEIAVQTGLHQAAEELRQKRPPLLRGTRPPGS